MADPFTYYGEIRGGADHPDDPELMAGIRKELNGKRVTWTVEEWKPKRTNKQNRAWFGVVIRDFCKLMGIRDKKAVHRDVLVQLGHYDMVEVKGRNVEVLKPTHNLPVPEFSDLYAGAQQLAAVVYGHYIEDPDPEYRKAKK